MTNSTDPPSPDVERVARAIFLAEGRSQDVAWEDADRKLVLGNWREPAKNVSDYYRDIARAAIAAMPGWQEIGTAKKDGMPMLGGDPRDGHLEIMWWTPDGWRGQCSGFWKPGDEPPLCLAVAPLPPPPKEET